MEKIYSPLLKLAANKIMLLFIVLFGTSYVANGQVQNYWVSLSGPAEAPPNNSLGTGTGLVTIDVQANTMQVQTTFSGLTGNVTNAHIHAPTAVAGTGTAGVATAVPTFPGFPAGGTSGTYNKTFDMTLTASYNPAYITANGGTPASAFAALITAFNDGKAYLNIHSNVFPGGEIRGFLNLCPAINVSIPDAFALPAGTLANTVYPAYAPASSVTLEANVSGGTGPYNYMWSTGATTSSITVSPTSPTTYTVNVTDLNGCPGSSSATKTVNVVNVSGGNKGKQIVVCHNGKDLAIGNAGVADHLLHGDMLGSCVNGSVKVPFSAIAVQEPELAINVLGNPSSNYFDIQIQGKVDDNIRLTVYDNLGRIVETKASLPSDKTVRLGNSYNSGLYFVEIVHGTQRQILKLVKAN